MKATTQKPKKKDPRVNCKYCRGAGVYATRIETGDKPYREMKRCHCTMTKKERAELLRHTGTSRADFREFAREQQRLRKKVARQKFNWMTARDEWAKKRNAERIKNQMPGFLAP